MSGLRATDVLGVAGYAVATPFTVWPPLFKHMWNTRDLRLLLVQEAGVALVVVGWLGRGGTGGAVVNGTYGVGLAVAYAFAGLRQGGGR